jgi:pimeloyl-ACP methyl ester carboxylesterase
MPTFEFDGQRIAYTEFGGGPAAVVTPAGRRARTATSAQAGAAGRPLILVHGLLLSQEMHRPLAKALAARGNRVITVDLLGHGKSDRPRDMWRYSMGAFAEQLLALMDHLELKEAAVMGTSLGANTALEVASRAPERLRGMVIEMPVLDNALPASAVAFTPILLALTFGEPAMRLLAHGARAIPRRLLPLYGNVLLDTVRQEPGPGGALLQGLFFGRVAPHRDERRTFKMPALVLGHRRDPVHPFSDAGQLASELPNGRLLEADSLVELRLRPERLTEAIASFLDEIWRPRRAARRPRSVSRPST